MLILLFLLPRSLFLSLQMIRDHCLLHCLMLLFLLPRSLSVTADDQRLSATLPDAPISPSTVSVSVNVDDQRQLTLLLHLLDATLNMFTECFRQQYM